MIEIEDYPYTDAQLKQRLQTLMSKPLRAMDEQEAYRFILGSIDLTTLEGSDNKAVVESLCRKAIGFRNEKRRIPSTAAVCVYPPFVKQAKSVLQGMGIRVASVAGAFPAGQSPIEIKVAEIKYAIQQGADEIDMVISRGKFLEGNLQEVFDEIRVIREVCKNVTLKVILETGELKTPNNIYRASQLAMLAGADFIKTSTGKISIGATPLSACVMMTAMRDFLKNNASTIGFKAAGGVSTVDDAWFYYLMMKKILNIEVVNNQNFRIGTSRLTPQLFNFLTIR